MGTLKTILQTLPTLPPGVPKTFYIVKKKEQYLTFKNNELALSRKQGNAVLFNSPDEIDNFIDNVTIDDRNERIIGNSYSITDITISKPLKPIL